MNSVDIDYEVNKIRALNIQHPTVANALTIVRSGFQSVKKQRSMNNGDIPREYKPTCGLISGPSGTGKTTLCNFIRRSLPPYEVTKNGFRKTITPCINLSVANMKSPKSVTARILGEFGQTVAGQANNDQMLLQLKAIFSTSETNLILLDEIHDIVPGAGVNQVMTWLKSLVNETRTSIFLAGTEDSVRIINSNAELKTRFKRHVKLHNMQFKLNKPSNEFELYLQKMLSDILKVLEFERVFKPNQLELTKLYLATDGNLENISTLMMEAARVALQNKDDELGFSHINEGFHATGLHLHTRFDEPDGPFVLKEKEAIKFARMLGA